MKTADLIPVTIHSRQEISLHASGPTRYTIDVWTEADQSDGERFTTRKDAAAHRGKLAREYTRRNGYKLTRDYREETVGRQYA